MGNDNVSPYFEKVNGGNFDLSLNNNFYFVTYHWKGVITRNTTTLRKCFYDIPGQNGSLSKLT